MKHASLIFIHTFSCRNCSTETAMWILCWEEWLSVFPWRKRIGLSRDSVLDIAFAPESAGCVRTGALACVRSKTSNWKQIQLESPPPTPLQLEYAEYKQTHHIPKAWTLQERKMFSYAGKEAAGWCRHVTRDFMSNKIYRAEISEMRSSFSSR